MRIALFGSVERGFHGSRFTIDRAELRCGGNHKNGKIRGGNFETPKIQKKRGVGIKKKTGVGILRFKTMVENEGWGYSFFAPLNAVSMVHG